MVEIDLKVVMLGESEVGKTSICNRLIHDYYREKYQTTICSAFTSKKFEFDGKTFNMGIWDTAGSERYYAMVRVYYRGAGAAVVCYDMTNLESFKRAKFWIKELKTMEQDCRIYLCATKCDLITGPREPTPILDVVQKYADLMNCKLFVTSSKTGENIETLFQEIAKDHVENPVHQKVTNDLIRLSPVEVKSRKWWCPC